MNKRELKLKTISNEFAKWQIRIENLTSLSLYDANLFSEKSICDLLNTIFDYRLKNVNPIIKNHPSIDLADDYNKVAVQVTSTKSKAKIQATLDMFFKNNLEKKYDELFVIILGKKQRSYSNIRFKKEFNFEKDKHILDFKDLLKFINLLPTKRIEKIAKLLEQETIPKQVKKTKSNAAKIKRNLALKKRMKKDFLIDDLPQRDFRLAMYNPSYKFKYSNVIIRSVDDTNWPNIHETEEEQISSWFRGEFWDFYDNGLELVSSGYYAIFNEEGHWDILDLQDKRKSNSKYEKFIYYSFLRIPYEYIVDYDMEPDDYYGVPTIYVKYAKDGMPYEEILYGVMGHYNKEDESKSRLTYYFDNDKRRKLK